MKTRKEIGKIRSICVGFGGYQDAMLGVSIELGGQGWGVGDFKGTWGMEPSEYAKWTKSDQIRLLGETMLWLGKLLTDAGKESVDKLINVPVEVEFESNTLRNWRILKEVL